MNRIVLDTETTNSLDDPICYDIGWAVIAEDGEVLVTRSFAIKEIIMDKELMASAYYAEKIPQYWEEIWSGDRKLVSFAFAKNCLRKDCYNYEVTEIYAHNARFDYRSCTTTERFITSSKNRFFFPFGVTIFDTLKMAREVINTDADYCAFCEMNGYKTKSNQNRLTAEVIYRFLTNNNNFIEAHKGIDDVLIEKEILIECLRRGATNGKLWDD